jgi:hypothetical protein
VAISTGQAGDGFRRIMLSKAGDVVAHRATAPWICDNGGNDTLTGKELLDLLYP